MKRFPVGLLAVISLGGAAGTLLRAAVAHWFPPPANGFPWDTWAVNMAGCALLGFVVMVVAERPTTPAYARPLVGTGFCGGLTTFSTLVVELDLLIKDGHDLMALSYLAASLGAGLVAAWAGLTLARTIWRSPVAPPVSDIG